MFGEITKHKDRFLNFKIICNLFCGPIAVSSKRPSIFYKIKKCKLAYIKSREASSSVYSFNSYTPFEKRTKIGDGVKKLCKNIFCGSGTFFKKIPKFITDFRTI